MNPVEYASIYVLQKGDSLLLQQMMALFGDAFDDREHYSGEPPGTSYHEALLANDTFVAITALKNQLVVGALTAYELTKPERRSKELFLFDLAVSKRHRRRGIATALIRELQEQASRRGASVIFVQAHREDCDAISLYAQHGSSMEVLQFEIPPHVARLRS